MASHGPRRWGHYLTFAVIVLLTVPFAAYQYFQAGGFSKVSGAYEVRAVVPTSALLIPNARVLMAGAEVGKVESVELKDGNPVVTMKISDDRVTPLPTDSRVAVRMRTPLGENYVQIMPGRSNANLDSGGVLPLQQAENYVDVDEILSLLDGKTKARAQQFIQSTGGALEDRGKELNRTLAGGARAFRAGSDLSQSIVGSRAQLSRLVDQFGQTMRAIGERGESVQTLARKGRVAMEAVASRDHALRRTLDELPPTLASLRTTSGTIERATGTVAPMFQQLATALRELDPGIAALQPAADSGRRLLTELQTASKPLRLTMRGLRRLAPTATDALPKLGGLMCEANPLLQYISPYGPEIIGTLTGLGSASNSYDANGHVIRLAPLSSDNSQPGLPDTFTQALNTLHNSSLLGKSIGIGWDPYPPPGGIKDRSRGLGTVGPTEWKGTYQRVGADC